MLFNPSTYSTTINTNQSVGNPTSTAPSVTTTDSTIVAANANRKKLILFNTGANRVYINFAAAAVIASNAYAFWLEPGGAYIDEISNTTAAVHGITASGSSIISVQEF